MAEFICSGCGACCTRVGNIPEELNFPEPFDDNGVCQHYVPETKQCSIYEDRPDICRVDKFWHYYDIDKQFPNIIDWFKYNNEFCNEFMKEDGLPESYLIDLSAYDQDS